jgi:thioredoxin reductase (NADPH)
MTSWDCVIVGGGPAGLSAAVYMGRFRRRTLVVDAGDGRWSFGQRNDNYLGFPGGVTARRLHRLGREQAERFGVRFRSAEVTAIAGIRDGFRLRLGAKQQVHGRTVIWATGVQDLWPHFPGARRLVGKRLFTCIVCDGWRARDRPVLLLGDQDRAVSTALQFLTYTSDITLLVSERGRISSGCRKKLAAARISFLEGAVRSVQVKDGDIARVRLDDGRELKPELVFALYGSRPKTELLRRLSVSLARNGHVRTDEKNRTSLARLFAAGDVNNKHSHQVASAVHEGAEAAQAANHTLYPPLQRI